NDARLAIRQTKLLHQQIRAVNHSVGVGIEKCLNIYRLGVGQAGHLERNRAAIRVTDGGWVEGEADGGPGKGGKAEARAKQNEKESAPNSQTSTGFHRGIRRRS